MLGDGFERVGDAEASQLVVDVAHEAVKVQAALGGERQRFVEQIHEIGFAAADAAPKIEAGDGFDATAKYAGAFPETCSALGRIGHR